MAPRSPAIASIVHRGLALCLPGIASGRGTAAVILGWAFGFVGSSGLIADISPPFCDKASGGQGNTSTSTINFQYNQAHLYDTVQVFPVLGMVRDACEAMNATGSVYIASGLLVRFLDNATLDPGFIYQC